MKATALLMTCLFLTTLTFTSCFTKNDPEPEPDPPSAWSLNGYWNRGDIVVYINGSEGAFYEINSGDWLRAMEQGFVTIGSLKFRYISRLKDDYYSGQELWNKHNGNTISEVTFSETGEFNLRNNGNTLYVNTKDPWSSGWNHMEYTRIYP